MIIEDATITKRIDVVTNAGKKDGNRYDGETPDFDWFGCYCMWVYAVEADCMRYAIDPLWIKSIEARNAYHRGFMEAV